MRDVLDVSYCLIAEQTGLVDPHEVRAKVDQHLRDSFVDRETWGMDAAELEAIPPAAPDG